MEILMSLLTNENVLCVILAYLIGSIPFGALIAKNFSGVNIRDEGSHSIGATNVLRVLKERDPAKAKRLAILTASCDVLKGVIPILVAMTMGISTNTLWSMAVFAVIGHCFSIYLKFEGGKGVATGAGVLAIFMPLATLVAVIFWALSAKMIRISSLSSTIAALSLLVASFIFNPQVEGIGTHAPIVIIVFIILYKHIPNYIRLIKGEEKRVV